MTANDALRRLHGAGLHLELGDGKVIVTPRDLLTESLRQLIRDNRDDLLQMLVEADGLIHQELITAIHRCCDARGDDETNRAGLIQEAADLPQTHQVDMAAHFDEQAALWLRITGRSIET
jgi:hypothetical protein